MSKPGNWVFIWICYKTSMSECSKQQCCCYSAFIFPVVVVVAYSAMTPVIKFLQCFENTAWKCHALLCFLSTSLSHYVPFGFNMMYQFSLLYNFSFLCAISRNTSTVQKIMNPNILVGAQAFCGTKAGNVWAHVLKVAFSDCLPPTQ